MKRKAEASVGPVHVLCAGQVQVRRTDAEHLRRAALKRSLTHRQLKRFLRFLAAK